MVWWFVCHLESIGPWHWQKITTPVNMALLGVVRSESMGQTARGGNVIDVSCLQVVRELSWWRPVGG